MGKERDIKLVEIIADAIVRGVDIVPLGTNLGFSNKTDTIEKADLFDRLNYLRAFIFHRSELFAKQEQPIIQHDPQGYYEALHARVMDKFEKLDPLQKAALSDVMGGYFSGSESYESAAKNMHEILMPEWVEKEKTDRALLSIWKKDREATRLGKSDEAPSGMHERFSQDSNLAQKIKDKIDRDPRGIIVVYGGNHTIALKNRRGLNVVQSLKHLGVDAMTVDPEIQGDVPCSEYACPTSVKKQEAVSAYHSFMRAALGEHDPDRITIKIDPVIVVPKESALKNERTKETPTVAAPP